MKRYLAIFGFVFIGVIAGLIVRGIPIVLQVNAGGGIQADRNGDVNGDARLDMSDAVYLLLHIFRDGPQPVALAQAEPADLGGVEAAIGHLSNTLPCKERPDRFIDNGDGTYTDTCTNLMWLGGTADVNLNGEIRSGDNLTFQDAVQFCDNFNQGGFTDWRLPTIMELSTLAAEQSQTRVIQPIEMFAAFGEPEHWSSTESTVIQNQVFAFKPGWDYRLEGALPPNRHPTLNKDSRAFVLPVRSAR